MLAHVVDGSREERFLRAVPLLPRRACRRRSGRAWRPRAAGRSREAIVAGYRTLADFMRASTSRGRARPSAPPSLPRGREYYAHLVRYYTTLDVTPRGGPRDRTRRSRADPRRDGSGHAQDRLPGQLRRVPARSCGRIRASTRRRPRSSSKRPAVHRRSGWTASLPALFGRLAAPPVHGRAGSGAPRAEVHGRPLRRAAGRTERAPASTGSTRMRSTSARSTRSRRSRCTRRCRATTSRSRCTQELTGLPQFRRFSDVGAFGEGWALYSEWLGREAGFYQDPYSEFGRLTYEMWRACRLVVDTGLHVEGWTPTAGHRLPGREHRPSPLHECTTETDRYISWPGQALCYKMGELKIRELREARRDGARPALRRPRIPRRGARERRWSRFRCSKPRSTPGSRRRHRVRRRLPLRRAGRERESRSPVRASRRVSRQKPGHGRDARGRVLRSDARRDRRRGARRRARVRALRRPAAGAPRRVPARDRAADAGPRRETPRASRGRDGPSRGAPRERARAHGLQLLLFAELIEEGSWVGARIDRALPERKPQPRPDLRRMLFPARARGGLRRVQLSARLLGRRRRHGLGARRRVPGRREGPSGPSRHLGALRRRHPPGGARDGMPEGVFAHAARRFAGSRHHARDASRHPRGGIHGVAARRTHALRRGGSAARADPGVRRDGLVEPGVPPARRAGRSAARRSPAGFAASVTLGSGQFCTNPGLASSLDSPDATAFLQTVGRLLAATRRAGTMVHAGIKAAYDQTSPTSRGSPACGRRPRAGRRRLPGDRGACRPPDHGRGESSRQSRALAAEIYGPATLSPCAAASRHGDAAARARASTAT